MNKKITTGIATLMISGMILAAAPALASQLPADELNLPAISASIQQDNLDENNGSLKYKVRDLENWQDLAVLRLEAKTLHAEIKTAMIAVRAEIAELKAADDKDALQALRPKFAAVKELREEFRQLRVEQRANWQEMKIARQAKDIDEMQDILDEQIIPCRSEKNDKLEEIKAALESILE